MAVTLHINFVGLFAFVRGTGVTYVLLPATTDHDHEHVEESAIPPHRACLYMSPNPWTHPEEGIPLERTVLRIVNNEKPGTPESPPHLLDLRRYTQKPVLPALLTNQPNGTRTIGRVELVMRASMRSNQRHRFKLKPGPPGVPKRPWVIENMATRASLTTKLTNVSALTLQRHPGGPIDPRVVNNTITLTICHVPGGELPPNRVPEPEPCTLVDHFAAYYHLFDDPEERPRVTSLDHDVTASTEDQLENLGGSTKTCPAVSVAE